MEQNKENTSSVSRTLKEYFIITVAVLIMDIGIYVFKFPNNFSFGGVTGLAVVLGAVLVQHIIVTVKAQLCFNFSRNNFFHAFSFPITLNQAVDIKNSALV